MHQIKYILIKGNASHLVSSRRLSDIIQHSIIVDTDSAMTEQGANMHKTLISKLVRLRRHYPTAKILGHQELVGDTIRPCAVMNAIRRQLSDEP